ncbi:MAG: hypothetical protein ACR2PS_01115 [Pseudomonadales bacterium]
MTKIIQKNLSAGELAARQAAHDAKQAAKTAGAQDKRNKVDALLVLADNDNVPWGVLKPVLEDAGIL